jgi:RNA polymerase primary sigma factor
MRPLQIEQSITARNEHSLHRYLSELDKVELISPQEEILLARKIKEGDKAALDRLVKCNLRFVVSCAKKYQHLGMPLSDLINEGNLGLIKAAKLFDETKGFKFISYAVWWIRQAMMAALGNDGRMIRLPGNMIRATADIRKVAENLEQQLERSPTSGEILEQVYIPNEGLAMSYAFGRSVVSLDGPASVNGEGEAELGQLLADREVVDADHHLIGESVSMQVKGMLGVLCERDREIVVKFFGLEGEPMRLEEIAEGLGLTRERVRQLKLGAIVRIRHMVDKQRSKNIMHQRLGYG